MPWAASGETVHEGEMMNPYSQAFKDHVRVYGLDNNLVLRMINTCDELKAEVSRLRAALKQMVSAYESVDAAFQYGSWEHDTLADAFDSALTNAAATLEPTP